MGPQAGKTIASGHYGGAGGILPEGRDHSSGGKRRASVVGQSVDGGKLCLEEEHAAEHPFGYGRLYAGLALAVALENAMAPLANTVHHTLP